MLELTKAIINNINQVKYLKNIKRVTLRPSDEDRAYKALVQPSNFSTKELEKLQSSIRTKNLRFFATSYLYLRTQRFFAISLPAMLTAVTIGLGCSPSRIEDGTVTTYKVTDTIYHSELGQTESEYTGYVRSDGSKFLQYKVAGDNDNFKELTSLSNKLSFKIYNESQAFTATFNLGSEGKISFSSSDLYDYIDISDFGDIVFNELEDEYSVIYDKVVDMLLSNGSITKSGKEALSSLTDDEKKTIIIEIIQYTKQGEAVVPMVKSHKTAMIIMIIITLIYLISDTIAVFVYDHKPGTTWNISNKNGELEQTDFTSEKGAFYGAIKLKEEFLAAERDRIRRIKKEIEDNLEDGAAKKLLTKYEIHMK